jgi:hypothetical protein
MAKPHRVDRLPLPVQAGEALARHLAEGRRRCETVLRPAHRPATAAVDLAERVHQTTPSGQGVVRRAISGVDESSRRMVRSAKFNPHRGRGYLGPSLRRAEATHVK